MSKSIYKTKKDGSQTPYDSSNPVKTLKTLCKLFKN